MLDPLTTGPINVQILVRSIKLWVFGSNWAWTLFVGPNYKDSRLGSGPSLLNPALHKQANVGIETCTV